MDMKNLKSKLLEFTLGAVGITAVIFGVKYIPLNLIGVNLSGISLSLIPCLIAFEAGLYSLKAVWFNGVPMEVQ